MTWKEYCGSVFWDFPKAINVEPEEYTRYKLNKIHPYKQRQVADIMKSDLSNIEYLYIFGSAKDMSCRYNSDLDIAIMFKDATNTLAFCKELDRITDYNYDLIFLNKEWLSEDLLNNIYKGVRYDV